MSSFNWDSIQEAQRPVCFATTHALAAFETNWSKRANAICGEVPSPFKGLVFGCDGRAMSPYHTKNRYGRRLALARGHRWLAVLESGEADSLREIADKEGVDNSYVSRMINLTCLAPDIVAAILDDTLPDHVTLLDLAVDPPRLWEEQRKIISL